MTTVCSELATHQLQMATLSAKMATDQLQMATISLKVATDQLQMATDESFLSATHEIAGPNTSEVTIFTVL